MAKVSKPTPDNKPAKPYPDFPLFPHGNGHWCKKIKGKFYCFGAWSDPDAAIKLYQQQRDDLCAGRKPRAVGDGLTVQLLVNSFMTAKQQKLDNREIASRTFHDYHATVPASSWSSAGSGW